MVKGCFPVCKRHECGVGGAIALACGRVVPRFKAEIGPVGEINVRRLLITLTGSAQGEDPPISDV